LTVSLALPAFASELTQSFNETFWVTNSKATSVFAEKVAPTAAKVFAPQVPRREPSDD
jgi:hypothetical protein